MTAAKPLKAPKPMPLQFAINVSTKISNALAGPHTVGGCELANYVEATGPLQARCSARMKIWPLARHGCAPCRSNALGALLVDALQDVKRGQLEAAAEAEAEGGSS